jgi:hypothetical protein
MQLKTLKTTKEFREALLHPSVGNSQNFAELIFKDKSVIGARVGNVRFSIEGYNTLAITTELPFEEAKRYRVEATHPAFDPVVRYFVDDWEANEFLRSFDNLDGAKAEKTETTVYIDDNGEVFDDHLGQAPIPLMNDDGVPF